MGPRACFPLLVLLGMSIGSWSGLSAQSAVRTEDGTTERPLELGMQERVERRLIQLDVTVNGPSDVISRLTADDFELYVGNLALGGRAITDLKVDRFCPSSERAATGTPEGPPRGSDRAPPPRASYVFYFDLTFMNLVANVRTREMVRELIEGLVDDDSPATIVSGGPTLHTYAHETSDHAELIDALERMASDATQADSDVHYPSLRLDAVREELRTGDDSGVSAQTLAQHHQKEEIAKNYAALTRLSAIMPSLAGTAPPKVLFYIGKGLNSRPGEAYFELFGEPFASLDIGESDPWAAARDFEKVVQDAAAVGVRIYPIFTAGPSHVPNSPYARAIAASRQSMHTLAEQTGGKDFLWGVSGRKIVQAVRDDLSCSYLLSFNAAALPEDRSLGIDLRVNRRKVRTRTRRQLIVRSTSERRASELRAAFLGSGGVAAPDRRLSAAIIPTDYRDGKYSALVQIALPAVPFSGAEWDFGVSLVWRGAVRQQIANHISSSEAGLPVVVEIPMQFSPGHFEIAMVARETTDDEIMAGRLAGEWPDFGEYGIAIGPIAVVQPASALFVREAEVRQGGSLGHGDSSSICTDRPTAFIGLVCREPSRAPDRFEIERVLLGDTPREFPAMRIELAAGESCAQVRDVIPAGTLAAGEFQYQIGAIGEGGTTLRKVTSSVTSVEACSRRGR